MYIGNEYAYTVHTGIGPIPLIRMRIRIIQYNKLKTVQWYTWIGPMYVDLRNTARIFADLEMNMSMIGKLIFFVKLS